MNALRNLPAVEECLAQAESESALGRFARPFLKGLIRDALEELRSQIIETGGENDGREELTREVLRRMREVIAAAGPKLSPVINATGVILHTNLGRALLAESAIAAMAEAARSAVNVEYDLANGARGDRDKLISDALCELTGAEAATVVNNNAAAVLLVLNTIAAGREVIVSRGELVEIGGSFRIPEVMERSGAKLREVGATNRTHRRDYAAAIGAETALLMKVHRSNFHIIGFTAEVGLGELVELGRERKVPVVEDLGAGALIDMSVYGLPREPIVAERIAAGADLVTFSGDKLLGGPQAGIIVGRKTLIEQLKNNPLWRAIRCDKLRLAALEATLRLYQRARNLAEELPTLRLLLRPVEQLEELAQAAAAILTERLGAEFRIDVIVSCAQIGSGALPAEQLESRAIRVSHRELGAEAIAAGFRRARVIGRIHDEAFLLDMRAVESAESFALDYTFQ